MIIDSYRGVVIPLPEFPRVVKILMRLPDDNISAAHPSVLYNQLIRQHDSLLAWRLEITGHCLYPDDFVRYCQVNEIETVQPIDGYIPLLLGHNLGARHLLPCTKCPRAKLAIVNRSRQVPTQPEQIAYHAINRKKALSLSS